MIMRIREILSQQGISTKELANRMGISQSALNQHISGNPSIKVLSSIASNLKVPIWQLFISPDEIPSNELNAFVEFRGNLYKAHTLQELEELTEIIKNEQNVSNE